MGTKQNSTRASAPANSNSIGGSGSRRLAVPESYITAELEDRASNELRVTDLLGDLEMDWQLDGCNTSRMNGGSRRTGPRPTPMGMGMGMGRGGPMLAGTGISLSSSSSSPA